jgi:hypothetical protein
MVRWRLTLPENAVIAAPEAVTAPAAATDAAAASVRKAELMADKAFRGKYLENDPAARAEMSALNRAIVGPDPVAAPVGEDVLDRAREMGVSDGVIEQIKAGEPVSQFEHDAVLRWKTAHMKDPEFLRKFFDGDYDARQKMFLANVTLSLPIKQG